MILRFLFSIYLACGLAGSAYAQHQYTSPQEAVEALVEALKADNPRAIVGVLGSEGRQLASSGDPVADASVRERFLNAYAESHEIRQTGDGPYTLYIGHDDFTFPIPLATAEGKWQFDTAAGAEEIINRRIGENELAAIEVLRAYVDAQIEYADADRDGRGAQYARRLLSRSGQMDGLYWPTAEGDPESPLGPLIAEARAAGYSARRNRPTPYHGYLFKVLTSQGADAPGGARSYILKGRMIGGFGLAAVPAEYGNSGVMSFIVNQNGVVYQKDLGWRTHRIARRMTDFNPDAGWQKVAD